MISLDLSRYDEPELLDALISLDLHGSPWTSLDLPRSPSISLDLRPRASVFSSPCPSSWPRAIHTHGPTCTASRLGIWCCRWGGARWAALLIAKACMQVLTTGATLVLAGVDARSAGGEPLPSADPLQRWACVRAVEAADGAARGNARARAPLGRRVAGMRMHENA